MDKCCAKLFQKHSRDDNKKDASEVPTNVNEMALAVQHDVAVVSVFYLQQEEQQAVRCHTADEVISCLERQASVEMLVYTAASGMFG